jgi:peroxiredoxin
MDLHIARIKFLAVMLCLLLPSVSSAQGFEISGESSLTGTLTLNIYDGDSSSRSFTAKANKGRFFFSGEVEAPTVASIQHATMQRPLYFYLENSSLSINVNASRPEASIIKGSRSNSEYRYLMERYRASADPNGFLRQYVKENNSSIYVPFILYEQMPNLDEAVVRQLVGQLTGDARKVYHYTLLRRWMRQTPAVSEGSEMPDFAFLDSKKTRRTFYQVRDTSEYTLLYFTANWCDICARQRDQAQNQLEGKNARLLLINIDDNPNGWDAQYLKQLAVDHLPYMILIDPKGIVVGRDLRIWELERALKDSRINTFTN